MEKNYHMEAAVFTQSLWIRRNIKLWQLKEETTTQVHSARHIYREIEKQHKGCKRGTETQICINSPNCVMIAANGGKKKKTTGGLKCSVDTPLTTRSSRFSSGITCEFRQKLHRKQVSCGFCFPCNTFVGNRFLRI